MCTYHFFAQTLYTAVYPTLQYKLYMYAIVRNEMAWSSPKWCMSEKNYRFFSDTRFCGIADAAFRPRHAGDRCWLQRPPRSTVTSQERYKTTNIWPHRVQAHGAEDELEWLQPSGR